MATMFKNRLSLGAAALVLLALTACDSDDGGDSNGNVENTGENGETGVVVPVPNPGTGHSGGANHDDITQLSGSSAIRYSWGGVDFSENFNYGATATSSIYNISYRAGTVSSASSATSGTSELYFSCFNWREFSEAIAPGNSTALALLSEEFVCVSEYDSGAANWYALSINGNNEIGGKYAYTSVSSIASGVNPFGELVENPDSYFTGTHHPGSSRTKQPSGISVTAESDRALYDALKASVEPVRTQGFSSDSVASTGVQEGESTTLQSAESYVDQIN